ncbi:hypothetical protein [Niabella ginsenosidivorans]|nr:hypothetical protein [Niabella ginsenosidivorans]
MPKYFLKYLALIPDKRAAAITFVIALLFPATGIADVHAQRQPVNQPLAAAFYQIRKDSNF